MTRAAVAVLSFRRTALLLRLAPGPDATEPDAGQSREAEAVGWAVRAAAARLPWGSTCLTQALAASVLLRRRGVPATVHLGVAKDGPAEGGLVAHAWVRCGAAILVGEGEQARFTSVATYSPPRPSLRRR